MPMPRWAGPSVHREPEAPGTGHWQDANATGGWRKCVGVACRRQQAGHLVIMVLAGQECQICLSRIITNGEASWCARCHRAHHLACLNEAGNHCPTCQQAVQIPENFYRYSEKCPVCLKVVASPVDHCVQCGSQTRWDTEQEFLAHQKLIRRIAIGDLIQGVVCGGLTVLGASYVSLWIIAFFPWCCARTLRGYRRRDWR